MVRQRSNQPPPADKYEHILCPAHRDVTTEMPAQLFQLKPARLRVNLCGVRRCSMFGDKLSDMPQRHSPHRVQALRECACVVCIVYHVLTEMFGERTCVSCMHA